MRRKEGDFIAGDIGRRLDFIATPYLHAPGAMATWDRKTRTLFTSDLCGAYSEEWSLFADNGYAERAEYVGGLARDATEFLNEISLNPPVMWTGLKVAYHSACSLGHGQKLEELPRQLLEQAGYTLTEIPEGHLCCGSAGTYNIVEPELSAKLRKRKVKNIESIAPDVIVTGNIGCMMQIGGGTAVPVVHTVELLDWATGGPKPPRLTRE